MFGRKAKLIKELRASCETNKITIRMQDDTIKKYMDIALERGDKLIDVNRQRAIVTDALEAEKEVSHAKDGRLIELQGQVAQQAAQLVHQAKLLAESQKEIERQGQELEIQSSELLKALEKIQSLEEELRQEQQRAQSAARASSFGTLNEVDSVKAHGFDEDFR